MGDDLSEPEEEAEDHDDVFVMAIEDDANILISIFSLMAKSDDEEDANEVIFELKDDLGNLFAGSLRKFAALLIDYVEEQSTEA